MNLNFNIPPVISSPQETVMVMKESSDSEEMTEEEYEAKVKELLEQCRQFNETAKECHETIKE